MSNWIKHDIEAKVVDILSQIQYTHHLGGRPFITTYQLATMFDQAHKSTVAALGYAVGGKGKGKGRRMTLTKYLSNQLSREIKAGRAAAIEGAFLANECVDSMQFPNPQGVMDSSVTHKREPLSMWRLREA